MCGFTPSIQLSMIGILGRDVSYTRVKVYGVKIEASAGSLYQCLA
jgi:hypothetical protein